MNKGPALILALLIVNVSGLAPTGSAAPAISTAGLSPESGAGQEVVYLPFAEDAGAFFFRIHTEDTACAVIDLNVTMDFWNPFPWLVVESFGKTERVANVFVDKVSGWVASVHRDNDPGTSHVMINGSVASYRTESGYDEKSDRAFNRLVSGICSSTTAPSDLWFSLLVTAPIRNAVVRLSFFESYDDTDVLDWKYFPGNATGTVTFAAESNRTFLKQLKDFEGTASTNGDPFNVGAGPSATAASVEVTIPTTRGFAGGFLDLGARPGEPEYSALSFQGPGGEAGAGTDATPGSPVPKAQLLHIAGSAGDWRFRAHAYAAPRSFSSLMVWGADIETGTPNPSLDTVDADRDTLPDDVEPVLCRIQNENDDREGRCPAPSDYEPPFGTPNARDDPVP